jgi:hypothetical protein
VSDGFYQFGAAVLVSDIEYVMKLSFLFCIITCQLVVRSRLAATSALVQKRGQCLRRCGCCALTHSYTARKPNAQTHWLSGPYCQIIVHEIRTFHGDMLHESYVLPTVEETSPHLEPNNRATRCPLVPERKASYAQEPRSRARFHVV